MAAFPAMAAARTSAFLLEPTFQTFVNRGRIAELAIQHRLPGVFTLREYAEAGGLMSYGPDWSTLLRQLAQQIDRILRGARPAELPMEQPSKFELVVNLATAKAIGLAIPQSVLAAGGRGDSVSCGSAATSPVPRRRPGARSSPAPRRRDDADGGDASVDGAPC